MKHLLLFVGIGFGMLFLLTITTPILADIIAKDVELPAHQTVKVQTAFVVFTKEFILPKTPTISI